MYRPTGRRVASSLFLTLALVGLSACGGGDDGDEPDAEGPDESTAGTVEEDPAADLDVIFEDDLEDDTNGWGEGETADYVTAFGADGYEISLVSEADDFYSYPDDGPFEVADSSTTVEVDDGGGPEDRFFGVACRISRTGPLEYYALTVNNDTGAYQIAKWSSTSPDEAEILDEGEREDLVGVGTEEPTHVTATCLGEGDGEPVDLSLSVDGTDVATITDEEGLGAGWSGLAVAAGAEDAGAETVTFTSIEIRGDEGSRDLAFEDDFSDPESGFASVDDGVSLADYTDGVYVVETEGVFTTGVPIRAPFPPVGTATVTIAGDLTNAFAGLCLAGAEGQYEFAISADGYGSLGLYPMTAEFQILDEVTDGYTDDGTHRITAGWNSDGTSTSLDLYVDDVRIASATDQTVTDFVGLNLCGTVSSDVAGTTLTYTNSDLVVTGEG